MTAAGRLGTAELDQQRVHDVQVDQQGVHDVLTPDLLDERDHDLDDVVHLLLDLVVRHEIVVPLLRARGRVHRSAIDGVERVRESAPSPLPSLSRAC